MINKKLIGNLFFYFVSFIATLFFFLGLILVYVNLEGLIRARFGFSLISALYFLIGIYILYQSVKGYVKFWHYAYSDSYKAFDKFFKNNFSQIKITLVISLILLTIFYTNLIFYLNFILKLILYVPMFALENLVNIVQIYLRSTFNLLFFSNIFSVLLIVGEIYYVWGVVKIFYHFKTKKNKKQ